MTNLDVKGITAFEMMELSVSQREQIFKEIERVRAEVMTVAKKEYGLESEENV